MPETKSKLTEIEELALGVIASLHKRGAQYEVLNDKSRKLMGDFPTYLQLIDNEVLRSVHELLEGILGNDDIASYYLYECVGPVGHGGGIVCCAETRDTPWMLRNIADLRGYLQHAKTCQGLKMEASHA